LNDENAAIAITIAMVDLNTPTLALPRKRVRVEE
jgi:hypothetical protein